MAPQRLGWLHWPPNQPWSLPTLLISIAITVIINHFQYLYIWWIYLQTEIPGYPEIQILLGFAIHGKELPWRKPTAIYVREGIIRKYMWQYVSVCNHMSLYRSGRAVMAGVVSPRMVSGAPAYGHLSPRAFSQEGSRRGQKNASPPPPIHGRWHPSSRGS